MIAAKHLRLFLCLYAITMKKMIPQNDYVLCILESSNKTTLASGFIYESNDVPIYKIVKISKNLKDDHLDLKVGNNIRVNATGTNVSIDNVDYVLFKYENIIGKIL